MSEDRRRRVQRLKKLIIFTLIFFLILPLVLCGFLFYKVFSLEKQLDRMEQLLQTKIETQKVEMAKAYTLPAEEPEEEEEEKPAEPDVGRKVYLTFDDGPSANTNAILDVLAQYNVKATFFVTATNADAYGDCYKRIVEEGHSIGIHSYSHIYQEIYSSLENYQADFNRLQEFLKEKTGQDVKICRFPGGSSNTVSRVPMNEIVDWVTEEGFIYYDWNVSGGDADNNYVSAQKIYESTIQGVSEHTNVHVLLHDSGNKTSTVEALPLIIEEVLNMEDTALLPITEVSTPIQHSVITKEY